MLDSKELIGYRKRSPGVPTPLDSMSQRTPMLSRKNIPVNERMTLALDVSDMGEAKNYLRLEAVAGAASTAAAPIVAI